MQRAEADMTFNNRMGGGRRGGEETRYHRIPLSSSPVDRVQYHSRCCRKLTRLILESSGEHAQHIDEAPAFDEFCECTH